MICGKRRPQFLMLALSLWMLASFSPLSAQSAAQAGSLRTREFRPGSVRGMGDIPVSRLRIDLSRLSDKARTNALDRLDKFHFTGLDLVSLRADVEGGIFYEDHFPLPPQETGSTESDSPPVIAEAPVPVSPFPAGLVFHSRPGSTNILYLNFTGENVTGTSWNTSLGRTTIPATAFSTDGDFTTFSDSEQVAIKRVWQRVSEDYAPFNIDVTTERPATFTRWTAHALVTRNTDTNGADNPSATAGGVAYVNVFGNSTYSSTRPAWIYFNNLANNESYISEALSHEIGHNMGLSHDGTTSSDYYGGHGSGQTSWGPLMGTGYNRNVSQWSKGDYYQANNTQDDLATISGKIGYRPDDVGGTPGTAAQLIIQSDGTVAATTPETDPTNSNPANKGVLERNTDVDVFSFVAGTGPIDLTVSGWVSPTGTTRGGNVDIALDLYDAGGTLLLTVDSPEKTSASLQTNLVEGAYYLYVRNVGVGDPFSSSPSGYTSYGGVGQYFISGTVIPSGLAPPPIAELAVTNITQNGLSSRVFAVTYSGLLAIDIASIGGSDILVTGTNGYSALASLVSINSATNGTPRVATYAAPAPDGVTWSTANNGIYTVSLLSNEVSNVGGSYAVAKTLGQFTVAVPRAVYFASMETNPGWTFQSQWQYGPPAYTTNTAPKTGFTGTNIIGFNLAGNYPNNLSIAYATTPVIDCRNETGLTLRFQRWLRLRSSDTARIQVSTNGVNWTNLFNSTASFTDTAWQQVVYALPSWTFGSPSLQLRWGLSSGANNNDIGWNIDDVEVLTGGNLDIAPPIAALGAANLTVGGSATHSITVTYSDASGIDVSTLGTGDIVVTGPNGYAHQADFIGVDLAPNGSPRTATYSVPAPDGAWNTTNNGIYSATLLDAEVADIFNRFMPQTALGSFTVSIPDDPQTLLVDPVILSVAEGGSANVKIRLSKQPTSSVPFSVSVTRLGGDSDLKVLGNATNQLDASNWSNGVIVTIIASPDADQANGSANFEVAAEGVASVSLLANEVDTTPSVTLTTTVNVPAWGTVSPVSASYPSGAVEQVVATPASYFRFDRWSGDVASSQNPLSVSLSSNLTVRAEFAELLTTNHPTPLWWLASYGFTGDPETAVDQIGANGLPAWQSYLAGLNPSDPSSQLSLRVTFLQPSGSSVLDWTSVSGRVYTVSFATNIAHTFQLLPGAVQLSWPVNSVTSAPSSDPVRFYRLEVVKP